MLGAAASLLNIDVVVLDVGAHGPAKQVLAPRAPALTHVDGAFTDPERIRELAKKVDVLTVEIEHVDVSVLEEVEVETTDECCWAHTVEDLSTVTAVDDLCRRCGVWAPDLFRRCICVKKGEGDGQGSDNLLATAE